VPRRAHESAHEGERAGGRARAGGGVAVIGRNQGDWQERGAVVPLIEEGIAVSPKTA